mmetsp:Transcript_2651/g.9272  ORF Transcript_2651/g.9272 Transcript_2651/m.9272 type:complete len:207 (-) Transcript_2651:1678-2298(-)
MLDGLSEALVHLDQRDRAHCPAGVERRGLSLLLQALQPPVDAELIREPEAALRRGRVECRQRQVAVGNAQVRRVRHLDGADVGRHVHEVLDAVREDPQNAQYAFDTRRRQVRGSVEEALAAVVPPAHSLKLHPHALLHPPMRLPVEPIGDAHLLARKLLSLRNATHEDAAARHRLAVAKATTRLRYTARRYDAGAWQGVHRPLPRW